MFAEQDVIKTILLSELGESRFLQQLVQHLELLASRRVRGQS
jgi:hypothetical protein